MYESSRYQTIDTTRRCINAATVTTFLLAAVMLPVPRVCGQSKTYTTTAEFDSAYLINSDGVDDNADGELAIRTVPQTRPYIWVACSKRGTIVRIDTQTRQVVDEYLSGPTNADGSLLCGRNPSRTTVDFDGKVWARSSGNHDDWLLDGRSGALVDGNLLRYHLDIDGGSEQRIEWRRHHV